MILFAFKKSIINASAWIGDARGHDHDRDCHGDRGDRLYHSVPDDHGRDRHEYDGAGNDGVGMQ